MPSHSKRMCRSWDDDDTDMIKAKLYVYYLLDHSNVFISFSRIGKIVVYHNLLFVVLEHFPFSFFRDR